MATSGKKWWNRDPTHPKIMKKVSHYTGTNQKNDNDHKCWDII